MLPPVTTLLLARVKEDQDKLHICGLLRRASLEPVSSFDVISIRINQQWASNAIPRQKHFLVLEANVSPGSAMISIARNLTIYTKKLNEWLQSTLEPVTSIQNYSMLGLVFSVSTLLEFAIYKTPLLVFDLRMAFPKTPSFQ